MYANEKERKFSRKLNSNEIITTKKTMPEETPAE